VASGASQYIAVGGYAIVGSLLPAVIGGSYTATGGGGGTFSFTVSGPPGTYGVYVSSTLTGQFTWLQNVTFSSGPSSQTVNDPNAGNHSTGFYYLGPPAP
jgi:hypothetical protein